MSAEKENACVEFLHLVDQRYQKPWAHISSLQDNTCIQDSFFLGFTLCSQTTVCNASVKLGAAEEVHSLLAPVLEGFHHTSMLWNICDRVPCEEYFVFLYNLVSFPRELDDEGFFCQCFMKFMVNHVMSGWNLKRRSF